jgi:hypothetical protein
MTSQALHLPRWPSDGPQGLRREIRAWWFNVPGHLRSPAWPTSLALLTIVALLLGFLHVVQMSVKQGELLRMTAATRSEAVWRCNALRNATTRASCLAQLDAPLQEKQESAPPPNTATMQVATVGR